MSGWEHLSSEQLDALVAENETLRAALAEARPYVLSIRNTERAWRAETARYILERVDAALAARDGDAVPSDRKEER